VGAMTNIVCVYLYHTYTHWHMYTHLYFCSKCLFKTYESVPSRCSGVLRSL